MNVNTIFARCGYRDPRSLRYAFMNATGLSPLAYRKKVQSERKGGASPQAKP